MQRRGLGGIGIVIAVCALALGVGVAELAPAAGAAAERVAGSGRVEVVGFTHAKKPKPARGYMGLRAQAQKHAKPGKPPLTKKQLKKRKQQQAAKKKLKHKKKKRKAATSALHNPLMLLVFVAISGLALFLIVSSLMSTPRARARARDRKRVRKPATP